MRLKKSFELALNILVHSKLRSWLTILGIIIGIAAVISIISISQGAQQELEDRLGGLGADILTVSPGFSRAQGFGGGFREGPQEGGFSSSSSGSNDQKNLTSKDVLVIKAIDNVDKVMGIVSGRGDMSYLSKSASVSIQGIDPLVWEDMNTETLDQGRLLTKGDSYSVVLGGNIVSSTFEGSITLNSQVVIEGKPFKVVGILESGSTVYIPENIARITIEDAGEEKFNSISVKIENVEEVETTIDTIEKKLMFSRGILDEKDKDFTVSNPIEMQETMAETMRSMAIFLTAIAAISLLVGAVGIANTMFTSVLEKTKDIGIMKAIGAKNRDILLIFLFNSGLIGLVGGIGGVLVGAVTSGFISNAVAGTGGGFTRMFSSASLSIGLMLFGLLFSMIIGMIAGVIPAYRASRLKPVDALRYE